MGRFKEYILNKFRSLLFTMTRSIVLKYFRDGLQKIEGSDEMKGQPIAWSWTFIDDKWERKKNKVTVNTTPKCLCELNDGENVIGGFCYEHKTDWL